MVAVSSCPSLEKYMLQCKKTRADHACLSSRDFRFIKYVRCMTDQESVTHLPMQIKLINLQFLRFQ
uniref:Uncharacterized protein n=1 Tax=Arundo donax TaxID=35708 RepID=A0A0A8Y8T7_ARUDO